jgi:myosin heavy subunit
LSVPKEEQQNLLKVLAAILHLGNLKFKKTIEEVTFEDEDRTSSFAVAKKSY